MKFSLYFPKNIVFGENTAKLTGQHVKQWGNRCIIVTGQSSTARSGTLKAITDSLKQASITYAIYNQVHQEPDCTMVDQVRALAHTYGATFVIGLGGGSALDVAKAAAGLYNQSLSTLEYLNKAPFTYKGIPFIGIPTTAGTGSEITLNAVLYNERIKNKASLAAPEFQAALSIIDPVLTYSMSPRMTAMTGMDALTHAMESYTSLEANIVTKALAKISIELVGKNLLAAVQSDLNQTARSEMALASTLAALAFTQTGVGLSHAISHPLGALFHIPHGLTNALLLAEVVDFNDSACHEDYVVIGNALGGTGTTSEQIRALVKSLPIPQTLTEAGYLPGKEAALVEGTLQSRSLKKNPREASPEDILGIIEKCRE